MEGKNYYIPTLHKLVHVHKYEGDNLMLGKLVDNLKDCGDVLIYQKIDKNVFKCYDPLEIEERSIVLYGFLQPTSGYSSYEVTQDRRINKEYFEEAKIIRKDAGSKKTGKFMGSKYRCGSIDRLD